MLKYTDDVYVGQTLRLNADNPMNCGYHDMERVRVEALNCAGDPIVRSVDTGHRTTVLRCYLDDERTTTVRGEGSRGQRHSARSAARLEERRAAAIRGGVDEDDILWEDKLERLGL